MMEPTRHVPTSTCLERREEVGLNTFEQGSADPWPVCGAHCDVFSEVNRGAITKAFNLGLKFQQSKPLNVETYNQGCLNPWGCVDNDGFACKGGQSRFGPFMEARMKELNKPYDPTQQEYHPPQYMMGIKNGTVNSVTGWARKDAQAPFAWAASATTKVPCPKK